ncbi:heat-inducible transcriptional repressor HrcA [bacterium]|nr:heat-inducible transcriptional repressor HrcA [bacterium]MBU1024764.1 heat-inducible transcriptional repressor HrcA [bacterium]
MTYIDEITDRQRTLLFVLIEEHIASGQPVSSEHLLRLGGFNCSSATIRNDLVKLENSGYVDKPHTSSGRLPTESGFKLYAAHVVDRANLDDEEKSQISGALGDIRLGILDVLKRASEFLSDETKMVSLVTTISQPHGTVNSIDLVPIGPESIVIILVTSDGHVENEKLNLGFDLTNLSLDSLKTRLDIILRGKKLNEIDEEFLDQAFERALISNIYQESIKRPIIEFLSRLRNQQGAVVFSHGLRNLIENPQFSESKRLRAFLRARNEEEFVNRILTDLSGERSKVRVLIGHDNTHEDMHKLSLVFTNFTLAESDQLGQLGVLGPTRMPYARIIPLVDYIAEYLSEKLGGRILLR